MWPYDYFNQFSNIEIDIKIGSEKKIFFAIWYGAKGKTKNEQDEKCKAFEKAVRDIKIKDLIFKAVIANKNEKGDFNTNILTQIIGSTFVVCDITPTGHYKLKPQDRIDRPVFNENVMFELGLASAWKMEEQVIVLWDNNDTNFPAQLPADIHSFHIDRIDSQYKGLEAIIRRRLKDFNYKKDILIKNLRNKLDDHSLRLLAEKHYGLMFTFSNLKEDSFFYHQVIARIRHLLSLGVLRTESFPDPNISFAYCWTDIGKLLLKDYFGIKLYPDILIDTDSLIYWRGYRKRFKDKLKEFSVAYNIKWGDIVEKILSYANEDIKKHIVTAFPKISRKPADILYHYLRSDSFDSISKNIIEKMRNGNKPYSRFFF